ncbi:origin recognition complex subunit 4 isoform X2 [Zootermopsis nevadensis]|uniref:origin recognition complex subunit 4 isoform X2 n=1 Tax=Zootermopsis nevadensis TaxID=136037 RepID=UPI000B8E30B5|nr:origin recognition complex subunit 4 isoform X2 [Zootermopsis nevadensis]
MDRTLSVEDGLVLCRKTIKRKLLLPTNEFSGHEKERSHLSDLVRRTVEMGESNSALLIGPRGCGKTALLNSVINELKNEKSFHEKAFVVELNGLMHTDDRLALKDATRQMQLENAVGNKVFGSFAENLTFLLQCLKSGNKDRSKSIIFILDEFDLFCNHHNQTLLYNLFNVAQSAQAPICVVGLTCRLDVMELLEKRVKSRFSHRQIFIFPDTCQKEQSVFEVRMALLKNLLILSEDDVCVDDAVFSYCWNCHVEDLCTEEPVQNVMRTILNLDNSERTLRSFLLVVISRLSDTHPTLTAEDFLQVHKLWSRDAKVAMVEGLSVLELCLIIAMKHQTEIYEGEPLNFEMVYRRYCKFLSQNSTVQNVERPVVLKAFEHLEVRSHFATSE